MLLWLTVTLVNPGKQRKARRLADVEAALPRRVLTQHLQDLPQAMLVLGLTRYFRSFSNPAS